MVIGNLAIYFIGVPWLMVATNQTSGWAIENGHAAVPGGDAVKLAVAAALLPVGWWVVNRRSSER